MTSGGVPAETRQTEYEEDTGRQFGIVPKEAFAKLVMPSAPWEPAREPVGQDLSGEVWDHLKAEGYLDDAGAVLAKFDPTSDHFELGVPEGFEALRAQITDTVSRYVFANRVINGKKRKQVRFRKQVTLDRGFKELWDRISQRTKYRVSLSSAELIDEYARPIEPRCTV